ncbi:MAG TPA: GNVR domain-containing protein [Gaiellales bacterium]|nr:GNVR domain-containing protein [Gaiellales bacterium]
MDPIAGRESSLQDYLAVIRRNRWLVAAAVIVVPLVAVAFSLSQPVRYSATARDLLNTQNLSVSPAAQPGSPLPQEDPARVAQTQADLARVPAVVLQTIAATSPARGLDEQQFLGDSSVSADPNSDLLSFTVTAGSKTAAKALATAYARAFTAYRRAIDTAPLHQARAGVQRRLAKLLAEGHSGSALYTSLQRKDEQLQSQAALQTSNATLVQPARTAKQVQPMTGRNAALGLFLGLVLGIGMAFLFQGINARVVTDGEVSSGLGLPLLGRLWRAPRAVRRQHGLVAEVDPGGSLAQAYRVVAATLESALPPRLDGSDDYAPLVAITSATAGEGRSCTVGNLCIALARGGRRVALVNADTRPPAASGGPSLDRLFGLDLQLGLADVLRGRATLDGALVYADVSAADGGDLASLNGDGAEPAAGGSAGLWVLPAGAAGDDLVGQEAMARLEEVLTDLATRVDIVLVDSPPLLTSAEALEMLKRVDAALVIVRANRITRRTLAELSRLLGSSPVYKLGFVLTDTNEGRQVYTPQRPRGAPNPGSRRRKMPVLGRRTAGA